jgi:hypothetical protein
MNKEKVKQAYESACNAYLKLFCRKHGFGYDPDAWVGGEPGGMALVADYYIDMTTIREDIDSDAPEAEFIRWYDYSLRAHSLGITVPNLHNWLNGYPVKSDEELTRLEEGRRRIEELKRDFERQIEESNKTMGQ